MSNKFLKRLVIVLFTIQARHDAYGLQSITTGVNIVNPQWLSLNDQKVLVDQLAANKVSMIRMPYVSARSMAFIKLASERSIKILLILDGGYKTGSRRRQLVKGYAGMWSVFPLSDEDAESTNKLIESVFEELDKYQVKLAGIEFGNEINWTAFNGDFVVPGRGIIYSLEDMATDPLARRIALGYDAWLRSLGELRKVRDRSVINRSTPIISAGLASLGEPGHRDQLKLDGVSIGATLYYLKNKGLDRLVDGYGIHVYPAAGMNASDRAAQLRSLLQSSCTTKQCWITEWGVGEGGVRCPVDDTSREKAVKDILNVFGEPGNFVKASVYFPWFQEGSRLSAIFCGRLTPSGKIAVEGND